jgi:hypothetical protein
MTELEWWKIAKKDAREAMGNLIKQTVDDNLDDMVRAKAYVKNHAENAMECAKADLYFATYVQASHEVDVHEAVREHAYMKATQTPAKAM